MEEAPENGKESRHSVHANGLIDIKIWFLPLSALCVWVIQPLNILCGQSVEFINVKPDGTGKTTTRSWTEHCLPISADWHIYRS